MTNMTNKEKLQIAEQVIASRPESQVLYETALRTQQEKRKSANLSCLFAFLIVLVLVIAVFI